jgi:hypothetical protein
MEKISKTTGIKIRGSSNVRIVDNIFDGLDVAIDAENTGGLKIKDNVVKNSNDKSIKLKWYKDPSIIIPAILTVFGIVVSIIVA